MDASLNFSLEFSEKAVAKNVRLIEKVQPKAGILMAIQWVSLLSFLFNCIWRYFPHLNLGNRSCAFVPCRTYYCLTQGDGVKIQYLNFIQKNPRRRRRRGQKNRRVRNRVNGHQMMKPWKTVTVWTKVKRWITWLILIGEKISKWNKLKKVYVSQSSKWNRFKKVVSIT